MRPDVLQEIDGPMLHHGLQGRRVHVPGADHLNPNRDSLAEHYALFRHRAEPPYLPDPYGSGIRREVPRFVAEMVRGCGLARPSPWNPATSTSGSLTARVERA